MTFPNRNCSKGTKRLHRTASLRHSESVESTNNPNMRRASTDSSTMLLSEGRSSPHDGSTPLIVDDSDFPQLSMRSTPCPSGRAASSLASDDTIQVRRSSNQATPGDPEILSPGDHNSAALIEEQRRLKDSITSLRQKLDASTALVDRLRIRNEVIKLETELTEKQLQQARTEQQSAMEEAQTATKMSRKKQVILRSVLLFLLLVLFVYVNWCLFYSPEVSYVRQRRRALLGL